MIETTNLKYLLSTSALCYVYSSHLKPLYRKLSKDALLDGTEPTVLAQWIRADHPLVDHHVPQGPHLWAGDTSFFR